MLSDGLAASDFAEESDLIPEYVERVAADMESQIRQMLCDHRPLRGS
jgi:hypothetical protein